MSYPILVFFLLLPVIHANTTTTPNTSPAPTLSSTPLPAFQEPQEPLLDLSTPVTRTYILTNHYWWESSDHQITTLITHLSLARNLSAIPILPRIPKPSSIPILPRSLKPSNNSPNRTLLTDYFTGTQIGQVQPFLTLDQFIASPEYRALADLPTGTLPFPKDSQEEFESSLNLFGSIQHTRIALPLPHVDPENTNQYCDTFPATSYTQENVRYVFLDRVHFLHFCAEKFLSWWYDIRHRIAPRAEYYYVADSMLRGMKRPVAVVHINDVLESEKEREGEEIDRYAREIVDALRKSDALGGSMYLIYHSGGQNVNRVVGLLQQEFDHVHSCKGAWECFERIPRASWNSHLGDMEFRELFRPDVAMRMVEWALGSKADVFVGNVHSPYSRNICLYRKSHGLAYSVLGGFGELKKIWKWNL